MEKEYDIIEVIRLRDEEKLKWKEVEEIIGVSLETLRKAYKREKEDKTVSQINPNIYINQKLRGVKRKYEAIMERGGKCEICGYDKNMSALEFHHNNPEEKDFEIDIRHFSNTSIEKLKNELSKCILVCANCHREIHSGLIDIREYGAAVAQRTDTELFTETNISSE